jgi:hypothetical protein
LAVSARGRTGGEAHITGVQRYVASVLRHDERVTETYRKHDVVITVVGGFLRPALRRRIDIASANLNPGKARSCTLARNG